MLREPLSTVGKISPQRIKIWEEFSKMGVSKPKLIFSLKLDIQVFNNDSYKSEKLIWRHQVDPI